MNNYVLSYLSLRLTELIQDLEVVTKPEIKDRSGRAKKEYRSGRGPKPKGKLLLSSNLKYEWNVWEADLLSKRRGLNDL